MRIHAVPTALLLGSAAVILLVALVLLLKGRAVRAAAGGFAERAVRVTASVVELEAKDLSLSGEPDTRYFPVVSFTPEGATDAIQAQTLTDVPAPPPRVGEQIEVAYDPRQPERVDVASTERDVEGAGRTWFLLAQLVAIAGLGIVGAWLVLVLVVWTS